MKPKYISCNRSLLALLIGGAILYTGCKKDSSITEMDTTTTPTTEESSQSVAALATSRANLLFEANFESPSPFMTEDYIYKQGCCSYSVTQSTTMAREGSGS